MQHRKHSPDCRLVIVFVICSVSNLATRRRIYCCQCSVLPRSRSWNGLITYSSVVLRSVAAILYIIHWCVDPSLKCLTPLHVDAEEGWTTRIHADVQHYVCYTSEEHYRLLSRNNVWNWIYILISKCSATAFRTNAQKIHGTLERWMCQIQCYSNFLKGSMERKS